MSLTPIPSLDRTASSFKTDVDTFFGTQIPQMVSELSALQVDVAAKQSTASAAAVSASNSEANASASALAASGSLAAVSAALGLTVVPVTGLYQACTPGNLYVIQNTGPQTITNMVAYSQDLTGANWARSNLSASISGTAPDGTATASLLTAGSTSNSYTWQTVMATPAGLTYTLSVYLKGVGSTIGKVVNLEIRDGLMATTIGFANVTLADQWQKVSVTATFPGGAPANIGVLIDPYANPVVGDAIQVWGVDLKQLAYPSIYLPTTSSSASKTIGTQLTLPTSPSNGAVIGVLVANSRSDNVVSPDFNKIQGLSEDLTIDNASASFTLRYVDSTSQWRIA